jgi:succinate dehydrogenase hydrophobic anchor subunit
MSVVDIPERPPVRRTYPGGRTARAWRWTVGSGVALVVLAAVHMVAQHFVVNGEGGLRTYQQVLDYIANPIIFVLECGFLFAVTIHALLGVRGILLDLDPGPRVRRWIDPGLWALGTITVAWGLVLLITLASRA